MRYGLTLPNGGIAADARTLGELAHIAEESGWDGVFLEDYIVWQGHEDVPTYDPGIALAEAGATWWMEYATPKLGSVDAMRVRIADGPARIE